MLDHFEESVLKDPGKALCNIAYYLFYFDLLVGILCLIAAFLYIADESPYGFPLLIVSLSILASAFSSALPIYAFGKLVQDVQTIKEPTKNE